MNIDIRYNDVISASDMVDQSPVRGENVLSAEYSERFFSSFLVSFLHISSNFDFDFYSVFLFGFFTFRVHGDKTLGYGGVGFAESRT